MLGSPFTPPMPFQQAVGINNFGVPQFGNVPQVQQQAPPQPEENPRVLQYLADSSGCGLYRMSWPSHILNYSGKAMITDTSQMILDKNFYKGLSVVRVQRQCSTHQKEFVKFLKSIQPECGFRLIYEVDDVVFREDIPDYNKFKEAFTSDEIRNNAIEIINMCDEMTVTCDHMRDLYRERTGKREITVIPNFPTRYWIGNFFNPERVNAMYDKHKNRPRILYTGSGAHYCLDGSGTPDDFTHVLKAVIDTRFKYKYVFMGAFPPQLQPYIQNGDMEFVPWQRLYDFPNKIYDLEVQLMIAPLQNNSFNRSKSDIKYIEACAFGIPVVCQDMETYKDAEIKFTTGEDMIKKIDEELRRAGHYKNSTYKRYKVAADRFMELDKNHDCYVELFKYPYGDKRRVNLSRYNK